MERLAEEIRRRAGEAGPRLTALRRHLHRHPEPAWGEYLTASLVARALQDAGFRLTLGANALRPSARPRQPEAAFCTAQSGRALNEGADPTLVACMAGGLTGLWGDLDLDSPGTPEDERGPLVAFRFDMDANAGITEATDKDHFPAAQGFASCHAGCMHACGHDGHVALGVELARLLGGLRDELSRHLSGRIRLIFQPAEEEGEGAPGMVAAGAVDGVRALFGLHLSMQASRSGDLVCGTDKFLATTNFEVFFTGQSAHAGLAPHEGRNALLAACTAVTNLLAIARHGQGASRINVGEMHVNETPNIIPAKAWLRGETRGENGDINGYMLAEARRVVDGAARMHGCRSRFLCQSHCPGAMSSPERVDLVERTARDMGSFREVRRKADFWASEDFGWFMNKVQEDGGLAAYLQLGADRPDGHHTSHFTFDESVLPRGLELLARLAVAALARRPD